MAMLDVSELRGMHQIIIIYLFDYAFNARTPKGRGRFIQVTILFE